mmetsp:Transcript_23666/g.46011  ORF Transcript_23666/g.46011 Transcript_23666/m.46011 type:complete len:81 (-) Transcript_23666:449-691(-)
MGPRRFRAGASGCNMNTSSLKANSERVDQARKPSRGAMDPNAERTLARGMVVWPERTVLDPEASSWHPLFLRQGDADFGD